MAMDRASYGAQGHTFLSVASAPSVASPLSAAPLGSQTCFHVLIKRRYAAFFCSIKCLGWSPCVALAGAYAVPLR